MNLYMINLNFLLLRNIEHRRLLGLFISIHGFFLNITKLDLKTVFWHSFSKDKYISSKINIIFLHLFLDFLHTFICDSQMGNKINENNII